jgi:hypothetical protein
MQDERNMTKISKFTIIIFTVTVVVGGGVAIIWNAYSTREIVLQEIKPTLVGFTNIAFVSSTKVKGQNNEVTVFRRNEEVNTPLVSAGVGQVWGSHVSINIGKRENLLSGDEQFGFMGNLGSAGKGYIEHKFSGDAQIGIDGDTEFAGNLDYDTSTYTFLGTVRLSKHVFSSDDKEPLVFKLVKDKGFVYLQGKGKVTFPDGKTIKIP